MRKNWLTTTAGIMASMITVPVAVAGLSTAGVQIPHWWATAQFIFIVIGAVGTALLGFASKGQDEHSTLSEVQESTLGDRLKTQNTNPQQAQQSGPSK